MNIIDLQITDIKPYANNPRKNETAIEQVGKSIEAYGFMQPLVVDKNNIIIVGHTRYYAAMDLDLKTIPVLIATDLNDDQCKAYRIADNKTGEFSEWDYDLLRTEIKNISDLFTGFEVGELEKLFNIGEESKDFSNVMTEKYSVRIDCDNEEHQQRLYEEFKKRGLKCQVLSL